MQKTNAKSPKFFFKKKNFRLHTHNPRRFSGFAVVVFFGEILDDFHDFFFGMCFTRRKFTTYFGSQRFSQEKRQFLLDVKQNTHFTYENQRKTAKVSLASRNYSFRKINHSTTVRFPARVPIFLVCVATVARTCLFPTSTVAMDGECSSGAALRRKNLRPRAWQRHVRSAVQLALVEKLHYSANKVEQYVAPRGQRTRATQEVHEVNDALRGLKLPPPETRPGRSWGSTMPPFSSSSSSPCGRSLRRRKSGTKAGTVGRLRLGAIPSQRTIPRPCHRGKETRNSLMTVSWMSSCTTEVRTQVIIVFLC